MTSKEGSATISGKQFQFIKLTIAKTLKLSEEKFEDRFAQIDFKKVLEGGGDYRRFQKLWAVFCNHIFIRDFKWKVLGRFGYLPKELRFSSLNLDEVGDTIQSFFDWQGVLPRRQPELEQTSGDSVSAKV